MMDESPCVLLMMESLCFPMPQKILEMRYVYSVEVFSSLTNQDISYNALATSLVMFLIFTNTLGDRSI